MHKTLVIARYRENIGWLDEIHHAFDEVIVYNKGEAVHPLPDCVDKLLALPNVGREGHTYAHHIVQNYSSLHGLIVFCQADPFPHFDPRTKLVNLQEVETYQPLSDLYVPKCCGNGAPDHPGLPLHRVTLSLLGHSFHTKGFWANGMFAVGASIIKARPASFYDQIVKMLEVSRDPIEGYCIERLWDEILNGATNESTDHAQRQSDSCGCGTGNV